MKILINGKLAALKENTSFEYIADNRLFSGSDGYSLTITFPCRHISRTNCRREGDAASSIRFPIAIFSSCVRRIVIVSFCVLANASSMFSRFDL